MRFPRRIQTALDIQASGFPKEVRYRYVPPWKTAPSGTARPDKKDHRPGIPRTARKAVNSRIPQTDFCRQRTETFCIPDTKTVPTGHHRRCRQLCTHSRQIWKNPFWKIRGAFKGKPRAFQLPAPKPSKVHHWQKPRHTLQNGFHFKTDRWKCRSSRQHKKPGTGKCLFCRIHTPDTEEKPEHGTDISEYSAERNKKIPDASGQTNRNTGNKSWMVNSTHKRPRYPVQTRYPDRWHY